VRSCHEGRCCIIEQQGARDRNCKESHAITVIINVIIMITMVMMRLKVMLMIIINITFNLINIIIVNNAAGTHMSLGHVFHAKP